MSTQDQAQQPEAVDIKVLSGSPQEVGAQRAADAIIPMIDALVEAGAPGEVIGGLLSGAISGIAAICANGFSPDAAIDMLRGTADKVDQNRAAFAKSKPH